MNTKRKQGGEQREEEKVDRQEASWDVCRVCSAL